VRVTEIEHLRRRRRRSAARRRSYRVKMPYRRGQRICWCFGAACLPGSNAAGPNNILRSVARGQRRLRDWSRSTGGWAAAVGAAWRWSQGRVGAHELNRWQSRPPKAPWGRIQAARGRRAGLADPAPSRNHGQGVVIAWGGNANGASNIAASPTGCCIMAQRKGSLKLVKNPRQLSDYTAASRSRRP
jgi:hypothetical protein